MITLYRRGRVWWARGSHRGNKIKPRSLDTASKIVAEKRRTETELDLDSGISAVTWPQFEQELLAHLRTFPRASTRRKYEFTLLRFGQFLAKSGISGIRNVTEATVADYTRDRASDIHPTRLTPIHTEGIKADLRSLRAIFGEARARGYIRENPVKGNLNSAPRGTLPFSDDEVSRMLADAKRGRRPDLQAILLTFLATGFRISDVRGLEKREVDLRQNVITRCTTKRGKLVSLPVHPELQKALVRHLASLSPIQQSSPVMFPTETGKRTINLDGILRRLWRRCGITGGHAHRFRDTFAVKMLGRGASLYDVAKLLGITVTVAERHYAPYVEELRARARHLVDQITFAAAA